MEVKEKKFIATRNACKVCTPLGASIAFKGIEGCVPLIHGSQGCATYIRRYLISHYKEPVDIASTNFTEESAIFGGERNLFVALDNINSQYQPEIIGIATTCLSETIGDDMQKILHKYQSEREAVHENIPQLVYVNTPSFKGTHADGFHNAVLALVKKYATSIKSSETVNIFPGFLSTEDIRMIKEIFGEFGMDYIIVPDYSDILDYEHTGEYERIPEGGTKLSELKKCGSSIASIEFGNILNKSDGKAETAAEYLEGNFQVPKFRMRIPIGIDATDMFFKTMENLSGEKTPEKYLKQRGRLIDAYVDGHKYVFGKKAVVYGEEDFVIAMTAFLNEIGIEVVLCASGGNSGKLIETIKDEIKPEKSIRVHNNYDFEEIADACFELKPDLLIGNSKGYYISRKLGIPIVRVGFPIHDRMGGQRIRHIGYEGTQELFDKIANTLIEYKQDHSPVGYKYM